MQTLLSKKSWRYKLMKFSEKAYVNRTAIIGHTIIDTILVAAYALELFKGSRTLGYFSFFALLCIVPVAVEWILYKKNPDTTIVQHLMCVLYGLLYLFVIFTTNSLLPFTYAFPMFMVIVLYRDVRSCLLVGAGAFIGNIVYVIYYARTVGYLSEEIPDVEIRVMCVLLTVIFMCMVTKAVQKVNEEKLKLIQAQTDSAEKKAENILRTSNSMIAGIGDAAGKVGMLGDSMTQIHDSMSEVSTGSTETAEAIQVQLERTEQIQEHISKVKQTASQIERNMTETVQKVGEGKVQMVTLSEQVEKSTAANAQVVAQMKALGEYTSQMNTIIETITSIASSTSLLALNASIEAARAGESGRGFAVVAGQISELANQTKSATVNVTALIENINTELKSVGAAVEVVIESNKANSDSAQVVGSSFMGIAQGTEEIGRQTQTLMEIVADLEKANADIVENIQTISAITEEVSAHAGETYNSCDRNTELVDAVTKIVENLNIDAQKLQQTE